MLVSTNPIFYFQKLLFSPFYSWCLFSPTIRIWYIKTNSIMVINILTFIIKINYSFIVLNFVKFSTITYTIFSISTYWIFTLIIKLLNVLIWRFCNLLGFLFTKSWTKWFSRTRWRRSSVLFWLLTKDMDDIQTAFWNLIRKLIFSISLIIIRLSIRLLLNDWSWILFLNFFNGFI